MSVLIPPIATPAPATVPTGGLARLHEWVITVDHKRLGVMYVLAGLAFFVIAGLEAGVIRWQLAVAGNTVVSPQVFNRLFTVHGTTMVFMVGIPIVFGFGNYLVPLMIGARDLAFPRLNALSFWVFLFGGLLLYFSFVSGGAPNAGWFSYAPLSEKPFATNLGLDYWAVGLLVVGIGTVGTGINLITTVWKLRAPGMTIRRLPLFVWMSVVNSVLIVLALPVLNASLVML